MEAVGACLVAFAASSEGTAVFLVLGLGSAELATSWCSDLLAHMSRSEVGVAEWEASTASSTACAYMQAWPECPQNEFPELTAVAEPFFDEDVSSVL